MCCVRLMSSKRLLSFRLPDALADDLKTTASEEDVSMTALASRYFKEGLNRSVDQCSTDPEMLVRPNRWHSDPSGQSNGDGGAESVLSYGDDSVQGWAPMLSDHQDDRSTANSALLYSDAAIGGYTQGKTDLPDQKTELLAKFATFIAVLEDSMDFWAQDISDDILEAIGDLSKLKAKLKSAPCKSK